MSFAIFAIKEVFFTITLKNQGVFSLIKPYLTNTQRAAAPPKFNLTKKIGGVRKGIIEESLTF